jgi:hypothetical protein
MIKNIHQVEKVDEKQKTLSTIRLNYYMVVKTTFIYIYINNFDQIFLIFIKIFLIWLKIEIN